MSGIYIHIPFCGKRCSYCDFYFLTNLKVIDKFLLSLKNEISISSLLFKDENFNTIFFGGGTPSLLSHIQIEEILELLYKHFKISSKAEITIEANPEDFLEKNLFDYRSVGINRISFGVQSFLDHELKFLTRQHTAYEAEKVITEASKSFDNINLDIIYSLPSQAIKEIDHSLSKAIELNVKHISAYTLTFEEKTVLFKSLQRNIIKKNTDSVEAELFNFVGDKLGAAGFNHYEVSNFARDGFECSHNLKYWNYDNYVGFGPSSHSMVNGERWNNFRDIIKYNFLLERDILPIEQKYKLTYDQKKLEYILLSLRSSGLNFIKYKEIFQEDPDKVFSNSMNELVKNNFGVRCEEKFSLNDKGYAIADEIVAKYF